MARIHPEKPEGCDCSASTPIIGDDYISYGKGKVDFNGFWSIPCPHGREFAEFIRDEEVKNNV